MPGGRYRVSGLLGEGGKKVVYAAHDTLLDRDVAFALIKTDGLDDAGRERVKRKAQALGRLGSHPNIVTVHDLGELSEPGEHKGRPFIVTELLPTDFPSEVQYVLAGRQWVEVLERPTENWYGEVLGAMRRFAPATDGGAT